MVDEMVKKTAAVLPLSVSVSVEEEKEKKKKRLACAALDQLPGVRDVILWTLLNAGNITVSFAFGTAYYMLVTTIFSQPPSWLLPRDVEMTDAEVAMIGDLMDGMLWCAAPGAAAGVLALMLPSHRRRLRLFLAYAALVVTVAIHCMMAAGVRMFVSADPGGLYMKTVGTAAIIIIAVGDLLCFMGLVLRGGEE